MDDNYSDITVMLMEGERTMFDLHHSRKSDFQSQHKKVEQTNTQKEQIMRNRRNLDVNGKMNKD